MSEPVIVVEYDPRWPAVFGQLRGRIAETVRDLVVAIEHVGSTSVPGLAAKPVIDLVVAVAGEAQVALAIQRLAAMGYVHEGDLGVPGREAFRQPSGLPAHHLYVCRLDNREYRRYLAFRNFLRSHPTETQAYAELKKSLAVRFRNDRAAYSRAKNDFIEDILKRADENTE